MPVAWIPRDAKCERCHTDFLTFRTIICLSRRLGIDRHARNCVRRWLPVIVILSSCAAQTRVSLTRHVQEMKMPTMTPTNPKPTNYSYITEKRSLMPFNHAKSAINQASVNLSLARDTTRLILAHFILFYSLTQGILDFSRESIEN